MKLELLVGNIASGKSTYCKESAENGNIIVNDDAIVNVVHAGNYKLYRKEFKPIYKSAENAILSTALVMGHSVTIDRPNHTIAMRRRYIGLAKSFDADVKIIMFKWDTPEIHARRRFESDSRGLSYEYWLEVARKHADNYEPPNVDVENYDELVSFEFPNKFFDERQKT